MEKKIYENYHAEDFKYLLQQEWLKKLEDTFGSEPSKRAIIEQYSTRCFDWKDNFDNYYINKMATDLHLNNQFSKRTNNEDIMFDTIDEVNEKFASLCVQEIVDVVYEVSHPTLLDDKFFLQASLEGTIGAALPEVPNTSAGSIVYNSLSNVVNEFSAMVEECKDYTQLEEVAVTLNKIGVVAPEFVNQIVSNAHSESSGLSKLYSIQNHAQETEDSEKAGKEGKNNHNNHNSEGR